MAKIKIPTAYKEVDTSSLSAQDVDMLLEIYSGLATFQKLLFQNNILPPPAQVKEEMIKIIGSQLKCE